MAEIVNLRRARKARMREEASEAAAVNRARHGRTPEQVAREERERAQRDRLLDGARREDEPLQ